MQLLEFWEESFVIFASYHADWCSCWSRVSISKNFPFYHFNIFLLLVLLAAIDYLWLFLQKRCFVKCENQSLFDCKLTGHHQRIKSIEEINDCYKKRTSQNPWSTCTWGSIYEPLICWTFCFTFSLFRSSVRNKQVGKVCRWNRIHIFLQKYF